MAQKKAGKREANAPFGPSVEETALVSSSMPLSMDARASTPNLMSCGCVSDAAEMAGTNLVGASGEH